jgi:hypothetical protein
VDKTDTIYHEFSNLSPYVSQHVILGDCVFWKEY